MHRPGKNSAPRAAADFPAKPAPGTDASVSAAATPAAAAVALAPPSEASRRLIRGVWDRGGSKAPLTGASAEAWQQNFEAVVKAGADSVSAIAEYLKENKDEFFSGEEAEALGFRSAREALLHALTLIGGPEALAVLGEELGATASPREVAMLARSLEAAAPGQYREQALAAARESLAMAAQRQLGSLDVAPLFEVFQWLGGEAVTPDLVRAAAHWGDYATLALGSLPEGAGVPSLVSIAEIKPGVRPNAARPQAMQVIAQLAPFDAAARTALLEFAASGNIASNLWPYLSRPLSGERAHLENTVLNAGGVVAEERRTGNTHVISGNQSLIWARPEGGLSPADAARHTALVEELRGVTNDPDARRILDQTLAMIAGQSGSEVR